MRTASIAESPTWTAKARTAHRQALRPVPVGEGSAWGSRVAVADQPLARVAALLLSIAQNNSYEGRDPRHIPDALTSGFVADLLGVDIGTLTCLLVDLRRRGLVETDDKSNLYLADVAGLEKLAG